MSTQSTAAETSTTTDVQHGTVTSADGTELAWSRCGSGPDLVMVHCVSASRATTPQPTLPDALAEHFTVWSFDRRGKGESGNNAPYAVEREFEDITAIIGLAEERPVTAYGFSSGGTLLLLAAKAGVPIDRLALLEPPLMPDEDPEFAMRAEGQRQIDTDLAGARDWFNVEVVGIPAEVLEQLPPPTDEDLRNTRAIVHELTFLPGTPAERFADVSTPTVVLASNATDPGMLADVPRLAETMPNATAEIMPGEWHGVDDDRLVEAIRTFAGG